MILFTLGQQNSLWVVKIWISELVSLSQAREWPKGGTERLIIPVDNGCPTYDNELWPTPFQQPVWKPSCGFCCCQLTTATTWSVTASSPTCQPPSNFQPRTNHQSQICSQTSHIRFPAPSSFPVPTTWIRAYLKVPFCFVLFSHSKALLLPACLWFSAKSRW